MPLQHRLPPSLKTGSMMAPDEDDVIAERSVQQLAHITDGKPDVDLRATQVLGIPTREDLAIGKPEFAEPCATDPQ